MFNSQTPVDNFRLIDDSFNDSISSLKYSTDHLNLLAASTWDGKLAIWEFNYGLANIFSMKKLQNAINDPILSISWGRNSEIIFAGCGDRLCRTYDLTTNKLINNYEHLGAVGDVFWCDEISCLVAMSYDGRITFWDPRSQKAVSQINFLEEFNFKPCSFSVCYPYMAVSKTSPGTCLLNLKSLTDANLLNASRLIPASSKLFHRVNCLTMFNQPNSFFHGWVAGCIDGRCEVKTFDQSLTEINQGTFTFKAHKKDNVMYGVNEIAFNRQFGSFATVGSDGIVCIWDKDKRRRTKQFCAKNASSYKYSSDTIVPVTACDFDGTGMHLAFALGYDWSEGVEKAGKHKNEVYVYHCKMCDVDTGNTLNTL